MEIPIVADRFARLEGSFALDLATGERVVLRVDRLPEDCAPSEWADLGAALAGVWHGSLAECLDFGLAGSDHGFVAFRASRRCSVHEARPAWARTRARVHAFLMACDVRLLTAPTPYSDPDERLVAIPTFAEGRRGGDEPSRPGAWFGIRFVRRAALQRLVDHLRIEATPGVAVHRVAAAPAAGGRTFLRHCAREVRQLGYVPVSSRALEWIVAQPEAQVERWMSTLSRRHLVVLHDGRTRPFEDHATHVRALLRLGTGEPRPRVLIELTAHEDPQSPYGLTPLEVGQLTGMVVCGGTTAGHHRRIAEAARTCGGRPGPFVDRLARIFSGPSGGHAPPRFLVHESSAPYGVPPATAASRPPTIGGISRTARAPGPREDPVADAVRTATALCRRGRHAAAVRGLRQVEAAAARRRLWAAAADLAAYRARICAARGRMDDAERAFEAGRDHADRARDGKRSIAVAAGIGLLRLQDGRIEQAESVLRSAATAATMVESSVLAAWASALVALCLWWQARIEEAHRVLAAGEPREWDGVAIDAREAFVLPAVAAVRVWRECTAVRIALSLQDAAAARLRLSRALHLMPPDDDLVYAMVRRVEARWHASVGDAAAFSACIADAAARAAIVRHPLDRLRALAGQVEGCVQLGLTCEPSTVRRLERACRRRLPGLLAFRLRLAMARWRGAIPPQLRAECVARRLGALVGPEPGHRSTPFDLRSPMYDDVIEALRICQEEEPGQALQSLLEVVRTRIRAAGAEFIGSGGVASVLAPGGARPTAAARRAMDTGLAIEPCVADGGIEAAIPLRFGGRVVGALACRWPGQLPVDAGRLMGFLAAMAAAAAPSLAALVEHHDSARARAPGGLELLGESPAMAEVRRAVLRAADAPFPVLIQGESGSGKELVARAVHRASARRTRAWCALNCAALPDDLLEAELFGHARGAFTGAVGERAGLFEDADGGVLFLDEVGELTPRAQAKLLRAIQEGEVKRVGETFSRKVDVRIVAATNRPLEQEVAAGRFRRDLRYRLDVVRIVVPALRERPEDVASLAQHFWKSAAARVGSRAVLSGALLAALARYDWPGNVRELQNVLAALAVSSPRRGVVGPAALPETLAAAATRETRTTLDAARRTFEERYVRAALARSGGHRGRAAAELGLTRQGLAKLMGRLGVAPFAEPNGSAAEAPRPRA